MRIKKKPWQNHNVNVITLCNLFSGSPRRGGSPRVSPWKSPGKSPLKQTSLLQYMKPTETTTSPSQVTSQHSAMTSSCGHVTSHSNMTSGTGHVMSNPSARRSIMCRMTSNPNQTVPSTNQVTSNTNHIPASSGHMTSHPGPSNPGHMTSGHVSHVTSAPEADLDPALVDELTNEDWGDDLDIDQLDSIEENPDAPWPKKRKL